MVLLLRYSQNALQLNKKMTGKYTRIPRYVIVIFWEQHQTQKTLRNTTFIKNKPHESSERESLKAT